MTKTSHYIKQESTEHVINVVLFSGVKDNGPVKLWDPDMKRCRSFALETDDKVDIVKSVSRAKVLIACLYGLYVAFTIITPALCNHLSRSFDEECFCERRVKSLLV